MNKKSPLLLFCILLLPFVLFSQQNGLKLYSNFFYLKPQPSTTFKNNDPNLIHFTYPSIALRLVTKREWIHEIETHFYVNNPEVDGETYTDLETHIRHEIGKYIRAGFSEKVNIQLAGSYQFYYAKENIPGTDTYPFRQRNQLFGISVAFGIHFEYQLSKRFYLDANMSIIDYSLGMDFSYTDHPRLTENQRKQGGFDIDLLSDRMLRIGVGYHFNVKDKE